MYELLSVKDKKGLVDYIQGKLPKCTISYPDIDEKP